MPKAHIDEELLILEVHKHACLYDVDSKHYKDNEMATNAWQEIGKVCEANGDECKARWRTLRDRYVRVKRESKTKSGQDAKSKKPWKYAEILSFLDTYIQEADTYSNLASFEEDQDIEPLQTRSDQINIDDIDVDDSEASTDAGSTTNTQRGKQSSNLQAPQMCRKPAKRAKKCDDPVGEAMLNYLQRDTKSPAENKEDEDDLFLRSQVPALKRLNPRKKAEVKFLIHELLFKAECFPNMQLSVQPLQVESYTCPNPSYGTPRSNLNLINQEWEYDSNKHYENL